MKLTIISDKGSPMMVVQNIKRKGNSLEITGQMMGAWPSKMYITLEEFKNALGLLLNVELLVYVLLYPFLLLAQIFQRKTPTEE